ncbi:hypothetical protein SCARR_02389 [Pontiella sulfatireligans]|uniref:Uncharacterized protein n=1 Tax=Pontiella sulfatireligans TaxID=2750658 RepID=A0A6C2ULM7_9BACT|nr:hypothetical protein SCARR_02389 [Pontiella sulfatireligans]
MTLPRSVFIPCRLCIGERTLVPSGIRTFRPWNVRPFVPYSFRWLFTSCCRTISAGSLAQASSYDSLAGSIPSPLPDNAQFKQFGDQPGNAAPKALLGIEHKGEKNNLQRENTRSGKRPFFRAVISKVSFDTSSPKLARRRLDLSVLIIVASLLDQFHVYRAQFVVQQPYPCPLGRCRLELV